jgi:hypothetical protein
MAEVAGTVVGVISLSIQLFDNLSRYTNGVKDAKTKAEQILSEVEDLANLLEELETITNTVIAGRPMSSVKRGICQCAHAMDMVKSKLGVDATAKTKSWAKLRRTYGRLMYPFKEADIKHWKDVLSSIQQYLNTALLALLMYYSTTYRDLPFTQAD